MSVSTVSSAGRPPGRPAEWLSTRSFARMLTAAAPSLYVVLVLIGPIVLIGLYSVNLRTNLIGVHPTFSLANWKDFLTGAGNPFRARFFTSLMVTVIVSTIAVVGA